MQCGTHTQHNGTDVWRKWAWHMQGLNSSGGVCTADTALDEGRNLGYGQHSRTHKSRCV